LEQFLDCFHFAFSFLTYPRTIRGFRHTRKMVQLWSNSELVRWTKANKKAPQKTFEGVVQLWSDLGRVSEWGQVRRYPRHGRLAARTSPTASLLCL
jgi:hypothetical protein